MRFVDEHKHRTDGGLRWGVESICRVLRAHGLAIAPATYYAATSRPPAPRTVRDTELKAVIGERHAANYGVYRVRKMHAVLRRAGVDIGRDQTGRLMRELGLWGAAGQGQAHHHPRPGCSTPTGSGRAASPRRLPGPAVGVDLTFIRSWVGWAYLALVIDVGNRRRRRLGVGHAHAHRPSARGPGDGDLGPAGTPRRPGSHGDGPGSLPLRTLLIALRLGTT